MARMSQVKQGTVVSPVSALVDVQVDLNPRPVAATLLTCREHFCQTTDLFGDEGEA